MSSPAPPPADPKFTALLDKIEEAIGKTDLGEDRWYLPAAACLVYHDPESLAGLYLHLIQQPAYQTPSSRQRLVRRLREALFKAVCLVGVCKPIESILAIAQVERAEDRDYTFSREGWTADAASLERGRAWFAKIYSRNAGATLGLFDAHRDFAWLGEQVTYGLFLSDRQAVDDVETQLVVLPAIMSQNLPVETRWHIRGTRRIGVSRPDVEALCGVVRLVAAHYGATLHRVPAVADVEDEV